MTKNNEKQESLNFYGLGIAEKLLEILEQKKITIPTPIQLKSIPITLEGKDVVGIAQTGTGKTLAFGIPMIQRLAQNKGRGLVVLPTRELALQVDEHLKMVGQKLGLRTAVLIGGEKIGRQLQDLRREPHIIVATPGRLIDHLQNKQLNLQDIKILVLDEADMMFDMGFAPQIEEILKKVPKERQTMLFSATMPPAIMRIVAKHMSLPVSIEVAPSGTTAAGVVQEMIVVRNEEKIGQLEQILKECSGSVLIFSRTKYNAKKLCYKISEMGYKTAEIHSNRSLAQRREALGGFKNGRFRVLVATDIAARGIDVSGIELVINYDLPDRAEDYVHRIGRTGRAGKAGRAISFVMPAQLRDVRDIERLIKKNIPVTKKSDGIKVEMNVRSEKIIERKKEFRNRGGKQCFTQTGKFQKNNDILSVFNPFKPNETRSGYKKYGGDSNKKFKKSSSLKRYNSRPNRPVDEKRLTDKQRFRKSMNTKFS